jgi:hypothetical protein
MQIVINARGERAGGEKSRKSGDGGEKPENILPMGGAFHMMLLAGTQLYGNGQYLIINSLPSIGVREREFLIVFAECESHVSSHITSQKLNSRSSREKGCERAAALRGSDTARGRKSEFDGTLTVSSRGARERFVHLRCVCVCVCGDRSV